MKQQHIDNLTMALKEVKEAFDDDAGVIPGGLQDFLKEKNVPYRTQVASVLFSRCLIIKVRKSRDIPAHFYWNGDRVPVNTEFAKGILAEATEYNSQPKTEPIELAKQDLSNLVTERIKELKDEVERWKRDYYTADAEKKTLKAMYQDKEHENKKLKATKVAPIELQQDLNWNIERVKELEAGILDEQARRRDLIIGYKEQLDKVNAEKVKVNELLKTLNERINGYSYVITALEGIS